MKTQVLYKIMRLLGTQHWISYGVRYRVIKFVVGDSKEMKCDFKINFFDHQYSGNLNSHIDWYIYFFGSYERHILFLLRDLAVNAALESFIDVGANVGQHSIFMSSFVRKVHAFEPYEPIRKILDANIASNSITNIVTHEVGIGSEDQKLVFYAPSGENLGVGSFVSSTGRSDLNEHGELPVVNGDRFFRQNGINQAELMKIDVEGFERDVIVGLEDTIKMNRPFIVMEFSRSTQESFGTDEGLLRMLPEDYEILSIHPGKSLLKVFAWSDYSLKDFDFNYTRGNILLAPSEKLATIRSKIQ